MGSVSKLPVNGFEWVEEEKLSKFNEDLIKKLWWKQWYRIFFWSKCEVSKTFNSHEDLPFLPERKKKRTKKLICEIKYK